MDLVVWMAHQMGSGVEAETVAEEAQLYFGAALSYTESAVVSMGDTVKE